MGFLKTTHRLGIPSSRHQVKFLQRRCRKHGPGVCWQPTLSAYRSRASKRSGVGARCGPAWRPWSIFNGDLNMKDGDATGKFLWRCEWWCPLVFNAVCNWKIPRAPVPVVLFQAVRYELGGVKLPASLKPRVVGLSRSAIGCEKCPWLARGHGVMRINSPAKKVPQNESIQYSSMVSERLFMWLTGMGWKLKAFKQHRRFHVEQCPKRPKTPGFRLDMLSLGGNS